MFGIRDPRSGIRKKSSRIQTPDPWGKKAPDPGSGSATLVGITRRVGKKTLLSPFAKFKTFTKNDTVFTKFRLFLTKGFCENLNLTKNGKRIYYW
jgi:hypothetical protein